VAAALCCSIAAALCCSIAAALCCSIAVAQSQLPTDRLLNSLTATADINDFAGILTPAERDSLEARCRELREKTGSQLAVVTLKSLEGGQIDDFAVKLFKRWGIGRKSEKDGVLLLVALEDRKARIEVGYGLEPILPDALAGRILDEQLFPAFKQGNYAAGLTAAVDRIIQIVEKNEPAPANLRRANDQLDPLTVVVLVLSMFVASGAFVLGAMIANGAWRWLPFSGLLIGIPFCIGLCLAFPLAPIVHVVVGLLLGWLGYRSTTNQSGGPRSRPPGGWAWVPPTTSTWDWGSSSGWSGGGFSGGGSSWGGFGGGSSGGGGASGGW
jgi:uncharacterized protein